MNDNYIEYNYNLTLKENGVEGGITESQITENLGKLQDAFDVISHRRSQGELRFLDLPYDKNIVRETKELAERIGNDWENIVVLGIGGSALGNITLFEALTHPFHNLLTKEKRGAPRFFAMDNIDPKHFSALLETIDIENTLFNVISKSGSTVETSATFMVVWNKLKERLGKDAARRVVAVTDSKNGILRKICDREKFNWLPTPDGVEGRFSVLSAVGLFSSHILGVDIEEILAGARDMDNRCQNTDFEKNPAYMNALIHFLSHKLENKSLSVMLPYSNSLKAFADWYRQIWAESIGKKEDRDGNIVYEGQTPLSALGATDQHSQLQLWREGPNDKIFTVIGINDYSSDLRIHNEFPDIEDVSYLDNHTINELIEAERLATVVSLAKSNRPVCTLNLPTISANAIGQLLYMYELQTAIAGELYNVNAFNQPGVEEGKLFAFGLMGRAGYEYKAEEINEWKKRTTT